jgi:RNA polymerase sigma-70 factor (ECF subfamily)
MGAQEHRGAEPRTLADVLDAKEAGGRVPRVPEQEWVALVRSIAAGDQQALQALYARASRIVFTLVIRIAGRRDTAEEVTLDVFHDVWRNAATYDPAGGSVLGWILNQARSRAIDRVRYETRKKRVGGDAAIDPKPEAMARGPHEALEASEAGKLLQRALQALPQPERQAIEASFFSELTHREAAARLHEPLGTVKTRIRSGLGRLRQALAEPRGAA